MQNVPRPINTDAIQARAQRIATVRRQIAAGDYETPERLDAATDALIEDLDDTDGMPAPAWLPPPPKLTPEAGAEQT